MTKLTKDPAVWPFEVDQVQNWAYWDGAFTKEECQKIIEIGEAGILQTAKVDSADTNLSVRDSEITWLYPSDETEFVFRRVTDIITNLNKQFFNFDLFGLAEGFQFTKYNAPSGFYGMHTDKMLNGAIRKLSVTIQLSADEDYEGGQLALYLGKNPEDMSTAQGKLIIFPSYVLHEVKPVTKGTRYSLVAWATGKPFK
jgi:PKHD-type hydroxylase